MRNTILLFLILTLAAFAQPAPQPGALSEDRVRLLVQEEAREIEKRLQEAQQKQMDLYQQEFERRAKLVEDKIEILNWLGGFLLFLVPAGIAGAIAYARNYARKKIEQEVDFAVYKLDPRRWPIRIPAAGFETERKRLEALGYSRLAAYHGLDANCKTGISVYAAASDEDLAALKKFMEEERVDPAKCCFVIYARQKQLNTRTLEPYDNFVISNMPGTLSSQIFAASRNITQVERPASV